MSKITAVIVFLLLLVYIIFQIFKNIQLNSLSTSLKKKDFEAVVSISDMPIARLFLGQFVCDYYKIRGYYLDKNVEKFEEMLEYIIKTDYKKNTKDKAVFLEDYFHVFIIKNNAKYSKQILDAIKEFCEEKVRIYCEQTYQVVIEKRNDLIETMDKEIEGKYYYGFQLGVILYMMAKQYEYLDNKERALLYYHNADLVFYKTAIYKPLAQKNVQRLIDEGYKLEDLTKE